jgi:hypothetical protein
LNNGQIELAKPAGPVGFKTHKVNVSGIYSISELSGKHWEIYQQQNYGEKDIPEIL